MSLVMDFDVSPKILHQLIHCSYIKTIGIIIFNQNERICLLHIVKKNNNNKKTI